jgi:transcriptional regulator GlxA family with amidase domain
VSAFVDLEQDVVTGVLEVPQHANDALARILAAIDERLDDPELSIGGLCRTLGMTERTLQRQLKEFTGRSPRAEVRERRLLRAKSLLTGGRFSSVAEVAAAVGMSPSTFSRTYRDWAGCSPRQDLR